MKSYVYKNHLLTIIYNTKLYTVYKKKGVQSITGQNGKIFQPGTPVNIAKPLKLFTQWITSSPENMTSFFFLIMMVLMPNKVKVGIINGNNGIHGVDFSE